MLHLSQPLSRGYGTVARPLGIWGRGVGGGGGVAQY